MKFGTLFSGGELAGVGIKAAGLRHIWGIENDARIAAVAKRNGFRSIVADILTVDPHTLETPDALHASPVCTRASNANQGAELNEEGTREAALDVAMGEKVAQFIDVLKPRVVTIENVYAYRNFKAFKKIVAALTRNGYLWDFDHLNAADFGVPQTRQRLILRAVRGALLPHLPEPVKWQGWYSSIDDLIDTLPAAKFAPWQLARLPATLRESALFAQGGYRGEIVSSPASEPAPTVTANSNQSSVRAFLLDSKNVNQEYGKLYREGDEPAMTVVSDGKPSHMPRAYLVNTREMHGNEEGSNAYTAVDADTPAYTLAASSAPSRHRAWLSAGRVVAMTPRALARFQSVPDWYKLPDKAALACKIIGNGVPCLLMQRVYEGLRPAPEQPR